MREAGTLLATAAVVGGTAHHPATGVRPGRHDYEVRYRGTTRVLAGTGSVSVTVRDRAAAALAVTSTSSAVGRLALRVGVTAAGAGVSGGTVTVKEGSTVVASRLAVTRGVATWSASGLRSGRHTYVVSFSGTPTVKPVTATTAVTVKAKVKPALRLVASSPAAQRVSLTITVTATGQPALGGTATVKEGSRTLKAKITVSRGRAAWSASGVRAGRHTYTVVYSGTSQVTGGSATVPVTVKKPVVVREYRNCDALHQDYPHGVGRPGAVDRVSGSTQPVTDFFRHTRLYEANTKSDRDDDDVACEKQ